MAAFWTKNVYSAVCSRYFKNRNIFLEIVTIFLKYFFSGGAADKSGVLKVGDEIIGVNNTDCTRMSRIEAWNFMKKLNDGTATIVVRQKIEASEAATPSKPLEVKTNAGNQDNMTTCSEQKEKLEAKR